MRSTPVVLFVPLTVAACAKGGPSGGPPSSTSEEARDRTSAKAAPSSDLATTGGPGDAAGVPTDLSAHGLAITIRLPRCSDGSAPKISPPMVKVAENASDRIISCDVSEADALAGKPFFAIQLGPASGKLTKKDVQEDTSFVKFLSEDPKSLEWQSKTFDRLQREFLVRVRAGGKEYACFSQLGTSDEKLYRAELDACRSIAAE